MSAQRLVESLRHRGFKFKTVDGRLLTAWPGGVKDAAVNLQLSQNLKAIVQFLAGEEKRKAELRADLESGGMWVHPDATLRDLIAMTDMRDGAKENVDEGRWIHPDYIAAIKQQTAARKAASEKP